MATGRTVPTFPQYYDGIVVGDPVYDLEAISFSELWGLEEIAAITPKPIQFTATTPPQPLFFPAFPTADQQLFTTAILQACDGLDGTVDGVIDNLPACQAKFDPATYVFSDTGQPLQCTGAKLATQRFVGTLFAAPEVTGDVGEPSAQSLDFSNRRIAYKVRD